MINRRWLVALAAVAVSSVPAAGDGARDAYKAGVQAEHEANYDAAYAYYKQAYTLSPRNAKYFMAYAHLRFNVSTQHLRAGQALRDKGFFNEALEEFQQAAEIDTSSFVAQQELRLTADMIRKRERQQAAPKSQAPAAKLGEDVGGVLELRPLSTALITLHVTANADVVYKTIAKVANLNVVIDPDYRPQRITVDLTDVTVREAMDLVKLQSKTYWRPVLENTIFVTADSAAKRKELEQNVMKTFYLKNITTPTDLQEAGNMVKQILDIGRVQVLQGQDALILRGTPDQMVLAEKLLADFDKPKSEVIIDVAVMQVNRDRLRTFGNTVPTTFNYGPLAVATGGTSAAASTGYTLGKGNFAVSIPSGSFAFLASDSNARILQNPAIRALNNEKSTLRIGDRVPIATGSFQPGIVGGGGVSPLVSTQFQYLDVGVNIDITPHIHSDREVTLKMTLEISSVTGSQSIGGITQPIIGQRRIDHEARLVDGDVNLLGGILEDTETQSLSGYPLISKIPILKYLFAQENRDHQENEIIFAITPHIVRALETTDEEARLVEVGTGSAIELRRKTNPPASASGQSNDPSKTKPIAPGLAPAGVPAPAAQGGPAGAAGKRPGPR